MGGCGGGGGGGGGTSDPLSSGGFSIFFLHFNFRSDHEPKINGSDLIRIRRVKNQRIRPDPQCPRILSHFVYQVIKNTIFHFFKRPYSHKNNTALISNFPCLILF